LFSDLNGTSGGGVGHNILSGNALAVHTLDKYLPPLPRERDDQEIQEMPIDDDDGWTIHNTP
jgi:hypothetical protein